MTDPLAFKFVDVIRPPCSKCGRPLVLTRIEPIEPEEPGFDLRTYFCAACRDSEVIIASVGTELPLSKAGESKQGLL
jgi:hypothetical protein